MAVVCSCYIIARVALWIMMHVVSALGRGSGHHDDLICLQHRAVCDGRSYLASFEMQVKRYTQIVSRVDQGATDNLKGERPAQHLPGFGSIRAIMHLCFGRWSCRPAVAIVVLESPHDLEGTDLDCCGRDVWRGHMRTTWREVRCGWHAEEDKSLLPLMRGAWLGKPSARKPKKRRFFQLSADGASLRWSWRKYVRLFYLEAMEVDRATLTLTLKFTTDPDLSLKFPNKAKCAGAPHLPAYFVVP